MIFYEELCISGKRASKSLASVKSAASAKSVAFEERLASEKRLASEESVDSADPSLAARLLLPPQLQPLWYHQIVRFQVRFQVCVCEHARDNSSG